MLTAECVYIWVSGNDGKEEEGAEVNIGELCVLLKSKQEGMSKWRVM